MGYCERDLLWKWSVMNVVCINESGLPLMLSVMNVVSYEHAL